YTQSCNQFSKRMRHFVVNWPVSPRPKSGSMRIDKLISQVTDYSRKDVKKLLKDGLVTLDGKPVTDPSLHVTPAHSVMLGDQSLAAAKPRYFMLNKPKGYVCATKDSQHPTVLDLLDEPNK